MVRYARRRPQSVLAIATLMVALAVACTQSFSCRPQPQPPTVTLPKPLPLGPNPTIRVRLAESAESVELSSTGGYRLLADGRTITEGSGLRALTLRREGTGWLLGGQSHSARLIQLTAESPGEPVRLNGRPYRGSLVIKASDDPARLDADNHVSLEAYLAGVLACELMRGWHQEAYNSLAVAARTYAMYEMGHAGRRRGFDVYDDQRSQVYGGVADETAKSLEAIRATWGEVLAGSPGNPPRVIKTYYSSTCGGVTNPANGLENQEQDIPALRGGVVCNDCAASPRYRWPAVRVGKTDIYAALVRNYPSAAVLGSLSRLTVTSQTGWNRPQWLDAFGPNGQSVRLRADDLRLCLLRAGAPEASRLFSMNCLITDQGASVVFSDGRGFGHGVGLCQYGSQGKALRGMNYNQILAAYFPGAYIVKAY